MGSCSLFLDLNPNILTVCFFVHRSATTLRDQNAKQPDRQRPRSLRSKGSKNATVGGGVKKDQRG
jgi:hypothetical protein